MAITVKNLTYVYQEDTPFQRKALNNIHLNIEDGTVVGILGASGSGKSTLLQHFNGVIPSKEKVVVNGVPIGGKNTTLLDIIAKISSVFQYPEHQFFLDTVAEEVSFGCKKLGYSKEKTDALVSYFFERFQLDKSFLMRSPFHLSGGEKRRVALVSILSMDTPILLLDEPTVGLDGEGKKAFLSLLRDLHQEKKKTILWVGHDIEEMAKVVERLIVMAEGEIVMDGSTAQVLQEKETLASYGISVMPPYDLITALKESFPALDKCKDGEALLRYFSAFQKEEGEWI